MRTILLTCVLLSYGCGGIAADTETPVSYVHTARSDSDVDSFYCAGDVGDGLTVYTRGAIWPDGTTFQYLELGLNGSVASTADVGKLDSSGTTEPMYLTVGGFYWRVTWQRADYPVIEVRLADRDWGYRVAGLCHAQAVDPHPGRGRTL